MNLIYKFYECSHEIYKMISHKRIDLISPRARLGKLQSLMQQKEKEVFLSSFILQEICFYNIRRTLPQKSLYLTLPSLYYPPIPTEGGAGASLAVPESLPGKQPY